MYTFFNVPFLGPCAPAFSELLQVHCEAKFNVQACSKNLRKSLSSAAKCNFMNLFLRLPIISLKKKDRVLTKAFHTVSKIL